MDRRAKDPVNYNRDYNQFIQNLQKFHGSRGSGFKRVPFFGGKELDLFLLYKTVTSLGGCAKVTDEKKWREVAKCFNLPASCTNAAFSLRQYYLRYLASYERFHFLGEDADDNSSDIRRAASSSFFQPSVSLFPSHVPESSKRVIPGPLGEPRVNNFNRLIFSLMSGLPNEVDFSLNICTLLSNVTNSIFNLAKAPTIVELMLAHVGIFAEGNVSMRELYKEWYQESDRDFDKFWKESIDDETVKEIYSSSCGCGESSSSDNMTNLFSDGSPILGESVEAKRVNQICVILHNFSYEELNRLFISSHSTCVRFLTYCAGSKLMSLRKTALDALDNVADKVTLGIVQDEETLTQLRVLQSFLFSKDRMRKVRAISILAKLSGQQENEDVLSDALPQDVYEELITCLTIPDIQLILNALDALYFLSDLGEATATSITVVYRSIDTLVCLVTVHAESYGNRAISGFRIVENKNSVHAQKHSTVSQNHQRTVALQQMPRNYAQAHPAAQQISMQQQVRSPKTQVGVNYSSAQPDAQKQEESEEVEPEIFAARWISAFYELAPGSEIKRSQIFADYLESCRDLGRKGVLNAQSFFKILGLVIPAPYWRPADNNDPTITRIRRRTTPLIVKNKNAKTAARVPDVSSIHSDQAVPVRPIPVMPAMSTQPQTVPRLPFSVQMSPQVTGTSSGVFQGQIEGPRATVPANTGSTVPTSAVSMPINSQGLPLKLLEQHVNSQGQSKDVLANAPSANASSEVSTPKQEVQLLQPQMAKQPVVQLSAASQSVVGNVVQGQAVLGSLTQMSQGVLIQGATPNVAVNASSANVVDNQSSLEPNVKLNSQQKLTSKERSERKKAMKAARDMINADIKASNLDPLTQCQNLTERIQKEMQQHFVQFHVHQQSIQAIQAQLQQLVLQNQQSNLPQNIMEDIHTRVRSHHAQMQAHYQKLQQLQILLQQVKLRVAQEQKLKEHTVAPECTIEDTSNQSLSRTPKTPRILRKQVLNSAAPGIAAPANVTPAQVVSTPPLSAAAVFGIASAQPANPVAHLVATTSGQQSQLAFMSSTKSLNVPLSNATMPTSTNSQIAPSVAVPGGNMNADSKPVQPALAPTQIAYLSNASALQGQAAGIQFTQAALTTPGKQGGAVLQKPVALTYNTPILPRPPTAVQNVPQQNLPNPAMVGQAVLFTMPVVALPQQGIQQAPSRVHHSQTQGSVSLTSHSIENVVSRSDAVSSNAGTLPSETTANENISRKLNVKNDVISNSTSLTPDAHVKCAPLAVAGANIVSPTISQGMATSPVIMTSVQEQSSLFNGPIKANSKTEVNGALDDLASKKVTPGMNGENTRIVVENGSENGKEYGTVVPDKTSLPTTEKRHGSAIDTLEAKQISKSKEGGLVNGGFLSVNGSVGVEEMILTSKETSKKRKLGESIELDLKNGEGVTKTELSGQKTLADGEESDDVLMEAVIKTNKKLKMNGIYVNSFKETGDDCSTENTVEMDRVGDRDNDDQERGHNDLVNGAPASSASSMNNCVTNSARKIETCDELSSEGEAKDHAAPSTSRHTLETSQSDSTDLKTKNSAASSCADERKEKHDKKKYSCQWQGCKGCFHSTSDLLAHMVLSHAPQEGSMKTCKVSGCKPVQRPRGSMICHFSQVHCNTNTVSEDEQVTLPQLLFPKVVDIEREDESPVTRSVRLTAALVLRNIARNSSYGRKVIMSYESRLAPAAMSSSEASSAVAACLEELTRKRRKQSDCKREDDTS